MPVRDVATCCPMPLNLHGLNKEYVAGHVVFGPGLISGA
jgi:hypothetical protein